ncbi:hypothetical protein ACFQDD_01990 [Halorubrum pallidum]|uniref:Uncharacterized protein n=1 Tax=Halorubrum pallidum TaxID=1526114 RepID=A0ABD5T405_9EURY
MSHDSTTAGETDDSDPFEGHRILNAEVTSNLRDIAVVELNETTQLKIVQHDPMVPVMAELYVGSEEKPIGTINTARSETVTLGGVDEHLAKRVDEIRDLPIEEIPDALDELAERLHPLRQEETESVDVETAREAGDE